MFLAVMCIIEASLPCTTNFFRFKKNYEDQQKSVKSSEDVNMVPSDAEKVGVKRKSLASPKIVSKLSPINTFVNRNIVGSSQKNTLMKYAENKKNSLG